MSALVPCADSSISTFSGNGFGPESLKLRNYLESGIRHLRRVSSLGALDAVLQSLDEVFTDCSTQGWDGYDASCITEASYIEAMKFIESLPLTSSLPMPEIVPEPSGEIALEWSKGSQKVFVASFSGKNEIIYAGLFGANKTHGTEYFGESPPSIIIENIMRIYS